jgi:hypothetical protein
MVNSSKPVSSAFRLPAVYCIPSWLFRIEYGTSVASNIFKLLRNVNANYREPQGQLFHHQMNKKTWLLQKAN